MGLSITFVYRYKGGEYKSCLSCKARDKQILCERYIRVYTRERTIRYLQTPQVLRRVMQVNWVVKDRAKRIMRRVLCFCKLFILSYSNRHFFTPQDTNPVVGSSTYRVEMNVLRVDLSTLARACPVLPCSCRFERQVAEKNNLV